MKKILFLVVFVVALTQGYSQTEGISYQAVILNPNDYEIPGVNVQSAILANANIAIQFTIVNSSNNEEYKEYHYTTTDMYGMINLLIGGGTPVGVSDFTYINWNGTEKTLEVAIDFSGSGTNYTPLSEQLLSYMPQPVNNETSELIEYNLTGILEEQVRAETAEQEISDTLILKEDKVNKSINVVTDGASDVKYPSVKAVKTYVDANIITGSTATSTNTTNIASNAISILLKANIASPTFTGTPTLPTGTIGVTQTAGANTTTLATTAFVTTAVTNGAATNVSGTIAIANGGTGATTKAAGFDALSPMTAAGDIIYGGVSGTGTTLIKGTANQVLTMNAGATAPAWVTAATGVTDINGLSDGRTNGNSVFLGSGAGALETSPVSPNTAVGVNALQSNLSGIRNVAVGYLALNKSISNDNTAIGVQALQNNTTGLDNIAIGTLALMTNTTANQSTAVGYAALKSSNGKWNVALGNSALFKVTSGTNNVAIGSSAGASLVTGSGNLFLGHNAGFSETGSNKLYISNTTSTTPLIYGEFDTNLVTINGALNLKNGTSAGSLSIYEASASGTNKVTLQTPVLAADYTLTLPVDAGTANQTLTTDGSGVLSWSTPVSSNSNLLSLPVAMSYTLSTFDKYVICEVDGISITLPTALGVQGKEYTIKNMAATNVVITTTGTEQIWQDATTKTTTATLGSTAQNNWIKVISDGTRWISFRALY